MSVLLAILMSCLGVEIFLRLPIAQSTALMAEGGLRAGRVILSPRISEHWKEKVMPAYAARMARQTVVLACLFGIFAGALGAGLLAINAVHPAAAQFLTSLRGLALGLAASLVYYPLRRRFVGA